MRKITKRLTTTGTWAASTSLGGIDLPREGIITEIILRATMTATLTASAVQDCTRRALEGLTIRGSDKTYLGLTGGDTLGRLLALLNQCDHGVAGLHEDSDVNDTSFNQTYIFHPGANPKDPFDLSAGIPAHKLGSLQALINTPAAAVTDAAGNITAGTYTLEVSQVIDFNREEEQRILRNLMVPAGYIRSWAQDANYASFGYKMDIPAGYWLRRVIVLSQDETATVPVRVNDEIGGITLELPKINSTPIECNWEDLRSRTARRYGLLAVAQEQALGATATTRPGYNGGMILPAGFAVIDMRDYFHPVWGMNLISDPVTGQAYQTGDAKLGFTITNRTAGDDTIVLWELYQPIDKHLLS